MSKLRVGTKVIVSEGSGLDSGRHGVIVHRSEVKTDGQGIPTNIPGAYRPANRRKESAVRLDNGRLITMFDNRLEVQYEAS